MATRKSGAAAIIKSTAKPSASLEKGNATVININHKQEARPERGTEGREEAAKKGKQAKVIRDSFTMPVADYDLLGVLKKRCIGLGLAIKKSELLRAGLAVLDRLPSDSLAEVVASVESVKTGRPPGKKKRKKRKKRNMKNRAKDRKP